MRDTAAGPQGKRMRMAGLHSDERLVRRAKKGDRSAFEAIFERYHQDLYRFCLMLVGTQQDAEDALQSTMVKLLRALPGERRKIRLRPWIYRIARNESIDTVRRRHERAAVEPEEVPSGLEIAETVEAREHLRRLIADIGELPERQRAALVMRELAGLDFLEIGSALSTSAGAARQVVYEARVGLRQMEVGREMKCEEVLWELSEADGRVLRRREIQAHLRACPECHAFQDAITRRRGELGALAPLPLAASAALLQSILGASSGAAAGGVAGAAGAGAGKALLSSVVVKSAATCVVVAAIGTTAADRGGLIDVPLGGDRDQARGAIAPPDSAAGPAGAPFSPGSGSAAVRGRRSDFPQSKSVESNRGRVGERGVVEGPGASAGGRPAARAAPADSTVPTAGHGTGKAKKNAGRRGQGKTDGLPPASSHGQQTAATHKSPHANASPRTPRGVAKGRSSPPSSRPERANAPPAKGSSPVEPPTEPPAHGKGGASSNGAGVMPTDEVEPPG